ncbi:MAG TPA: hypothetical protein VF193_05965 [Steroidobacter sp.]
MPRFDFLSDYSSQALDPQLRSRRHDKYRVPDHVVDRHPDSRHRSDLPQFVRPGTLSPLIQLLALSAVFMVMTLAVFIAYGLLAHAFRRIVIESTRVRNWIRYSFAAAFAGLGIRLAMSER